MALEAGLPLYKGTPHNHSTHHSEALSCSAISGTQCQSFEGLISSVTQLGVGRQSASLSFIWPHSTV